MKNCNNNSEIALSSVCRHPLRQTSSRSLLKTAIMCKQSQYSYAPWAICRVSWLKGYNIVGLNCHEAPSQDSTYPPRLNCLLSIIDNCSLPNKENPIQQCVTLVTSSKEKQSRQNQRSKTCFFFFAIIRNNIVPHPEMKFVSLRPWKMERDGKSILCEICT